MPLACIARFQSDYRSSSRRAPAREGRALLLNRRREMIYRRVP